ncbi:MAG: hypothetical protein WCB27_01870 [Thermoguttaceae bacterium]
MKISLIALLLLALVGCGRPPEVTKFLDEAEAAANLAESETERWSPMRWKAQLETLHDAMLHVQHKDEAEKLRYENIYRQVRLIGTGREVAEMQGDANSRRIEMDDCRREIEKLRKSIAKLR